MNESSPLPSDKGFNLPAARFRWPEEWQKKPAKKVGAITAVLVLAGMAVLPVPPGMPVEAFRALLLLLLAMCLWLPEVFHPSVSSLLLVAILPLTGAVSIDDAASGLGDKIIWLLLGVSLLTAALQSCGLDRRIAFHVLRRSGGTAAGVLLAVIMTGLLFAFLIPNAVARTGMMVPLCVGILNALGVKPLHSNLGRSMLLATSITSLISSAAVMTGASATIYAAGFFESVLDVHWTYLDWLMTMLPGVLLACLAQWLILIWVFPPETKNISGGMVFVEKEIERLGPMNFQERKLLWVFAGMFAALLFGHGFGIARETTFIFAGLVLFLPGIDILNWSEASKKVDWGTLIFFAASLTLSNAIVETGAASWLADQMVAFVAGMPVWIITLGVMVMFMLLRFAFTNMTSVLTTLLPVVTTLALSIGRNPVWLGMIAVVASALCLFTPMQSASNFTSYTAGYYQIADFAKVGVWMAAAVILITLLVANFYWPLVGLQP